MKKFLVCLTAGALFIGQVHSVLAKPLKLGPAGTVVKNYCTIDALGGGATSVTSKYLLELSIWEDGPGWEGATLIDDFVITNETYEGDTAKVTVKYHVVGKEVGESKKKLNTEETINFDLIKTNDEWKIKEPQLEPHIFDFINDKCFATAAPKS